MKRSSQTAGNASVLLVALVCAGCPDDVPKECKVTCELCCEQEESCTSADYDECFSTCFDNCQRAYAVYRHSACWDARLLTKECVCNLSCTALDEWEEGTSDHCAAEVAQEAEDCDWF